MRCNAMPHKKMRRKKYWGGNCEGKKMSSFSDGYKTPCYIASDPVLQVAQGSRHLSLCQVSHKVNKSARCTLPGYQDPVSGVERCP